MGELFVLLERDAMHCIQAKSILSARNGMNLYRGCQHACIYCDSRSRVYGMEHEFEDVAVKENGLELLEQALRKKRRLCMIGTGSMSDPYMPLERELEYSRRALEIIYRYGFGATLITKSDLVLRDIDLLSKINERAKCVVQMTLTTCDERLCKILEPGVCTTKRRFEVLCALRDAGIPTVVWLSPILPFINDTAENINGILAYCEAAGVKGIINFGMGLTLRDGNREYFYAALERDFPGLRDKYIRVFGESYGCMSPENAALMALFHRRCEKTGIMHDNDAIFQYLNEFEKRDVQLSLF